MTETLTLDGVSTVGNPEAEVDEQGNPVTPETTDDGKGKNSKTIFVDEAALAEYKETPNKNINFAMSGLMYAALAQYTYAADDDNKNKVDGRIALKGGAIADVLRDATAAYIKYEGVKYTEKERSNAAKEQAAKNFTQNARNLFTMARQNMQMFNMPEDQAFAQASAIIMQSHEAIAPQLAVTPELLKEIWNELAQPVAA